MLNMNISEFTSTFGSTNEAKDDDNETIYHSANEYDEDCNEVDDDAGYHSTNEYEEGCGETANSIHHSSTSGCYSPVSSTGIDIEKQILFKSDIDPTKDNVIEKVLEKVPKNELMEKSNIPDEACLSATIDLESPLNQHIPTVCTTTFEHSNYSQRRRARPEKWTHKKQIVCSANTDPSIMQNTLILFNEAPALSCTKNGKTKKLTWEEALASNNENLTIKSRNPSFTHPIYCNNQLMDNFEGMYLCQHRESGVTVFVDTKGSTPLAKSNPGSPKYLYYYLVRHFFSIEDTKSIISTAGQFHQSLILAAFQLLTRFKAGEELYKYQAPINLQKDIDLLANPVQAAEQDAANLFFLRLLPVFYEVALPQLELKNLLRFPWHLWASVLKSGDMYFDELARKDRNTAVELAIANANANTAEEIETVLEDLSFLHMLRIMIHSQKRYVFV